MMRSMVRETTGEAVAQRCTACLLTNAVGILLVAIYLVRRLRR